MPNDLDNLITRETQDGERECKVCHRLFSVYEGDWYASVCDECGREKALIAPGTTAEQHNAFPKGRW